MGTRQLVIFSVDNEEFGIDISQVNIIERPMDIYKIPNAPEYVEGLVNLRGKVHTVFDLRKRFNLSPKKFDESTKIIMANVNSTVVGIIVDEVKEITKVEDIDTEAIPKALSDMKSKFLNGIAKIDERIILLLDLDAVLTM